MEPQPLPVLACTLTGPEQAERAGWLERMRAEAIAIDRRPDGVTIRFADDDTLEAEARALAAAEAECCPFLTLTVTRDKRGIELSVSAPPEGRELVALMFEDGLSEGG
jgi:hypothetical protein